MKVGAIPAEARFDNVVFSNEVIDGVALPVYSTYACPRCSERIAFRKDHFEDRALRRISNLDGETQQAFDDWASSNARAEESFLDWHCPRCNLPARVYVEHWAGGRFGDAGVNLKVVLEPEAEAG